MGVGTVTSGHGVGYLTKEVAAGREGYYTSAVVDGEPAGRWHGRGAAALGLRGDAENAVVEAVFGELRDPRDPTGEARLGVRAVYLSAEQRYAAALAKEPGADSIRRAELWAKAEDGDREPVAFYDWTFSAQKSISVAQAAMEHAAREAMSGGDLAAAALWAERSQAVDEAILAACGDALDHAEQAAGYARIGHHGGGSSGTWIDAHALTAVSFVQHDSRARDPQLHVHNAILNNVECADGKRRALDGKLVYREAIAMTAIASRSLEARLADRLGWSFVDRQDGNGRELDPSLVPTSLPDAFSARRQAIVPQRDELATAFRAEQGREPTRRELAKLAQQATLATRPAKSHDGTSKAEQVYGWAATAAAAEPGGFPAVAERLAACAEADRTRPVLDERDVIERALVTVDGDQRRLVQGALPLDRVGRAGQTWTRADLIRALDQELPPDLGLPPERVGALLGELADAALAGGGAVRISSPRAGEDLLPAAARLADGSSALARPGSARYATVGQLAAERELRAAAVRGGGAALSAGQAQAVLDRYAAAGAPLGADQAAAVVGILTSGAAVSVLSAPAGTGKTFAIGAIADAWQAAGGRVIGLAQSQIATDGLADEGLAATRNLSAFLAGQERDANGHGIPDDAAYRLTPRELVVVDEAGMADTGQLLDVQRRCAAGNARLVLTGDPRQLAAIGAGGTLSDLTGHAATYELTEVRRFDAPWEAAASLRLRAGDTSVIAEYDRHGRVRDGGTIDQAREAAARAHLASVLDGRDSLLIVQTNEHAAAASAAIHDQLMQLGRVDVGGVPLRDGTVASVGDLVQYRALAWHLAGFEGNVAAPITRGVGRVIGVRENGGLVTAPIGRGEDGAEVLGAPMQLPGEYVAAHLTLGYASTITAAQGRTVEVCFTVAGQGTTLDTLYVSMSRGRDGNVVYVVTRATAADAETGEVHDVEPRPPAAVLRGVVGAEGERNVSALQQQERSVTEELSARTLLDQLSQNIAAATAGRTGQALDLLAADGRLTAEQRAAIAADDAYPSLDRLLRLAETAGHDRGRVLSDAVGVRSLSGARSEAKVLYSRVTEQLRGELTPRLDSFRDLIPADHDAAWTPYLAQLADLLDERRDELGAAVAERGDGWAVLDLGPVPDDPLERLEWEYRAGWAEMARELGGVDGDADPLGGAPPTGAVEEQAVWRTAHHVLDRPEAGAEEAEASTGLLRARDRAWERERAWLPPDVDGELAATTEAAAVRAADATLWAARAEVEEDPVVRERLRADADAARADAERLAELRDQLEEVAAARDAAVLHTAVTRDKADRARTELAIRGVDRQDTEGLPTAAEWLEAREAADRAEDPHREVTAEEDLSDAAAARAEAHLVAVREAEPDVGGDERQDSGTAVPDRVATARDNADAVPTLTDPTAGEPSLERGDGGDPADGGPAPRTRRPSTGEASAAGDQADHIRGEAVTEPQDIRETATRDESEDTDSPDRRRVPPADRTREAVDRARDAMRELAERTAADQAREAADQARSAEADREAQDRHAAEAVAAAATVDDGLMR